MVEEVAVTRTTPLGSPLTSTLLMMQLDRFAAGGGGPIEAIIRRVGGGGRTPRPSQNRTRSSRLIPPLPPSPTAACSLFSPPTSRASRRQLDGRTRAPPRAASA